MPITVTHQLDLTEAGRLFPVLASVCEWRLETPPCDQSLALAVPKADWPRALGVDAECLLLVLPDDLSKLLPALAESSLDVHNSLSDDLLACETLLSLAAGETEVRVDGWLCRFSPRVEAGKFYLAIAAADRFVLACHNLGQEALRGLLAGWQSACNSSGVNYRPYRIWSDEQLAAASRGESIFEAEGDDGGGIRRRVTCIAVSVLER